MLADVLNVFIYFGLLIIWSSVAAYFFVFVFFRKKSPVPPGPTMHANIPPTMAKPHVPSALAGEAHVDMPNASRGYSTHLGFKSFARGPELTVEDIVKGLSRD